MKLQSKTSSKKDYCGPEDNPILSAIIPDSFLSVDFSDCCKDHDAEYKEGGTEKERKKSDKKLKTCIKCRLLKKFGYWTFYTKQLWLVPQAYYLAVKNKGKEYFKYA